jgi:hypothetical protein
MRSGIIDMLSSLALLVLSLLIVSLLNPNLRSDLISFFQGQSSYVILTFIMGTLTAIIIKRKWR